MIPIITIQGPTAVGKSSLAIKLAKELNTEIISADSRQIYRFTNIGTAKPSPAEMAEVKHHLINIKNPDEKYNAGDFVKDADKIINDLHSKNKIPIIVGGTAFYIKSLIFGLFKSQEIPQKIKDDINKLLIEKGNDYLYEILKEKDPESADRIHKNDTYRLVRSLEIYEATGKKINEHWKEQKKAIRYDSFNILVVDDRERLYERINNRIDFMIQNGLLNEVDNLLKLGFHFSDPGLNSVGYIEWKSFFNKITSIEECIDKIKQNSRHYAKRQLTWYRKVDFDLTLTSNQIILSEILTKIKAKNNFGGNK